MADSATAVDALPETCVSVHHGNNTYAWTFPGNSTLSELSQHAANRLSIPVENQKFLLSPKPGLIKAPFRDEHASLLLKDVVATTKKITLLGSTKNQLAAINSNVSDSRQQVQRRLNPTRPVKAATPIRTTAGLHSSSTTQYTFLQLRPLPYLPHPERSLRFLERLKNDPGILSVMAKHRWSVPLLTEMDPAAHTTHESRTLGLNRNGGEVIELRLRTDAYDGYRDYKTIRKTLCHELTHNVHGEHDADFWALCRQVEKEVDNGDWRKGGRTVGDDEYYEPVGSGDDPVSDYGGWTGGEFILGGGTLDAEAEVRQAGGDESGGGFGDAVAATAAASGAAVTSRREILARAAEERMKREKEGKDRS